MRALAGEDDHADRRVLARPLERVGDLDQRLRPEGVADLRPVDRDLGDPVAGQLVADVLVVAGGGPVHGARSTASSCHADGAMAPARRGAAARRSRSRRREGSLTYAELLERARGATRVTASVWRSRCRPAWTSRSPCTRAAGRRRGGAGRPARARAAARRRRAGDRRRCSDARPAPARAGRGDAALVVHTSGTTGAPRPVALSLGQHPGQRARLRGRARARSRRALAVPAAAAATSAG